MADPSEVSDLRKAVRDKDRQFRRMATTLEREAQRLRDYTEAGKAAKRLRTQEIISEHERHRQQMRQELQNAHIRRVVASVVPEAAVAEACAEAAARNRSRPIPARYIPKEKRSGGTTKKRQDATKSQADTKTKGNTKGATKSKGTDKGATTSKGSTKGATKSQGTDKGATTSKGSAKGATKSKGTTKGATTGKGSTKDATKSKGTTEGATKSKDTTKGNRVLELGLGLEGLDAELSSEAEISKDSSSDSGGTD